MSTLAQVLRERATKYLMRHNVEVPTKSETRRRGGSFKDPRIRQDHQELARHPGDSRNVVVDRIKAVAATETGCRLATPSEERRMAILQNRIPHKLHG